MAWSEFGKRDTKANELHRICKYLHTYISDLLINEI